MKKALVKSMIAPLYVSPKFPEELDDEALYGMCVEIVEEYDDGWYKIRTPYNYVSNVNGEHLCFDEAEIARYGSAEASLMSVYAPTADVLGGAKYQAPFMRMLTRGALVEVLPNDDPEAQAWAKLRLIGGEVGYVRKAHLGVYHTKQNGDEAEFRKNVVATAMQFMGTQYRWGGRTPLGIDCSGLCSAAYYLNGVYIYRNARIKEGFPVHEITREQMKEGDMLYFKGHVAMYIGNGEYVHSTGRAGSDGVVLNSLDPGSPIYREDLEKGILCIGSIF